MNRRSVPRIAVAQGALGQQIRTERGAWSPSTWSSCVGRADAAVRSGRGESYMSGSWKFKPPPSMADLTDLRSHDPDCAIVHDCALCTCGAVRAAARAAASPCDEIGAEPTPTSPAKPADDGPGSLQTRQDEVTGGVEPLS
jgi:hypothetical protein